jgi:hypothetical protein
VGGGWLTVYLPVLLLGVLLEVGCKKYVLGLDTLEVFGHLVRRAQEVDVLVNDIGWVFVLLATGEGIDCLPLSGILR